MLLVLAAAAVGIFLWRSQNVDSADQAAPRVATQASEQPAASAASIAGVAIVRPPAVRHRLNLDSITTASQLQHDAAISDQPGQALELLRLAAMYCEIRALDARYKTQRELRGQMSAAELRSLAYQRAFGKRFCNVQLDSTALADKFLLLDTDDDVLRANFLGSLDESDDHSAGISVANQLVRESDAPEAIARSAQFVLGSGGSLPQAEGIPEPPGMDDAQARFDAQMMAVAMLACEMRGGCGPGGLQTVLYCGRLCGPTVSLADVWRQSVSPQTLAYAHALAAAIRADRASVKR